MKQCVVVLGMHRSGTSVLSGLISLQGFYLGADEMPVREDNPMGFFENMKIYHLNQSILDDYNASWDNYNFIFDNISPSNLYQYEVKARKIIKEEFGLVNKIFIKDPRMCLLFPLWDKVLKELGFDIKIVLAYRSPMEVASSLKSRNDIATEKSILMWSHYFFQAEKNSRDYRRMIVHYANDFQNIDEFFILLAEFLNISPTESMKKGARKLYSPKLKHYNLQFNNISDEIPRYLKDFIIILHERKLNESKEKLNDIIDEFYFSQDLYLYSNENKKKIISDLNDEVIDLKNESATRLKNIEKYKQKIEIVKKTYCRNITLIKDNLSKVESNLSKVESNLSKIESNLSEEEKSLLIANEVFLKIYANKNWNKKLGRTIRGNNYFKIKYFLLPLIKKSSKNFLKNKIEIVESGLFSSLYYLTKNPDVWEKKIDPLTHYCQHGWKEGRNPGANFNTQDYLSMYEDVVQSGINPLLHYIQFGVKEGRRPSKFISPQENDSYTSKNKKSFFYLAKKGVSEGRIDSFDNGYVSGYFLSKNSIPIINVNNISINNIEREENSSRFRSKISNLVSNKVKIELLSLDEDHLVLLDKKTFNKNWFNIEKYADLERAKDISNNKKSVAITVWEGAHNPIGRAKVLYDIVKTKRPAIIFAYIFGDFGDTLWEPLRSSGVDIVLIPYQERHAYHEYIQRRNIKFNTVWICKHRLHSFELASMISKLKTACILDMDDNEDVFIASKPSEFKPYGIFSKNKSDYYLDKMLVRSVASSSLLNRYGGMLVRHARKEYLINTNNRKIKNKTAVFIGTIRPHKNISELVNAVSYFNDISEQKISLAIGGDFNPSSLKQKLSTQHTIILDKVSSDDLFDILSKYDVLITGFPSSDAKSEEINKYQITSKIGDGLSVGCPVLTPFSPSVMDLYDIPGLFIFTQENFNDKLQEALEYKHSISLPKEFSFEYCYKTFEKLENKAKKKVVANDIFMFEALYNSVFEIKSKKKNLVLIWKQHDAGIYGRRIDHIARYYKRKHPDYNVTVIEAMNHAQIKETTASMVQFDNSTSTVNEILYQKLYNYNLEGVNYRLIPFDNINSWNLFEEKIKNFLTTENIYPYNSVIILFPLHQVFNKISSLFEGYKIIVDLVDNQIKWITTPEKRVQGLKQYHDLISIADEVVSNSSENLKYFTAINFFEKKTPCVISNWYTLPRSISFQREVDKNTVNLIYSGNMNDRIDWELLKDICKLVSKYNGYLHIVGSSIRKSDQMKVLLSCSSCVYHGVIKETQLLRLLQHIDVAVMPHIEDSISKFMDPIKLKMYEKLGITTITSKLPTLPTDNPLIIVTESTDVFLDKLNSFLKNCKNNKIVSFNENYFDKTGESYVRLIDNLLKE